MQKTVAVRLATNKGNIDIRLNEKEAPITAENFLKLVKDGFYDGLIFHRVIDGFMIQGGGMTSEMQEKSAPRRIRNEAKNGLKNDRGTVAMARTSDPDSAGSQFFINLKNNDFLNYKNDSREGIGYAVFGHVTSGMDVVDKIAKVKTGRHGYHQDVPTESVLIQKAYLLE